MENQKKTQQKNKTITFGNIDINNLSKDFFQDKRLHFRLKDGTAILRHFLSLYGKAQRKELQWLPEYEEVGQWLEDNEGLGLRLAGECGLGKTILGAKIIPEIFRIYHRKIIKVYDAGDIAENLEEAITKRLLTLDELGLEPLIKNTYGNLESPAMKIIDNTEKKGNLLILTTNLGKEATKERYGIRGADRLRAITKGIAFKGESKR